VEARVVASASFVSGIHMQINGVSTSKMDVTTPLLNLWNILQWGWQFGAGDYTRVYIPLFSRPLLLQSLITTIQPSIP